MNSTRCIYSICFSNFFQSEIILHNFRIVFKFDLNGLVIVSWLKVIEWFNSDVKLSDGSNVHQLSSLWWIILLFDISLSRYGVILCLTVSLHGPGDQFSSVCFEHKLLYQLAKKSEINQKQVNRYIVTIMMSFLFY